MELGTSNELIASFKLEINDWGDRRREFTPKIDPGTNNNTQEALVTIWTRQHYFTDRDHVYENFFLDQSTAEKLRVVKEIVYLSDPDSLDRDRRRCSELETMAMVATNVRPDQKRYFFDFLGWYERKDRLCLVLEYCSYGNIDQCFPEALSENTVRTISEQVLEGLAVLHGLGITHRDIKPQNILVAQEDPMWVKIADFGISKHDNGQTDLRSQVGTEGYMAPEILLDETKRVSKYSNAVYMWSFGCLVYYLLTKKIPFPRYIGLKDYYEGFGLFPDEDLRRYKVGESGINFVRCLMDSEPEKRPIASGQLVTQWINDSQDTTVPQDGILPEEPQDPDSDSESGSRRPSSSLATPQPRPPIEPTMDYWSSELLRITKTPKQRAWSACLPLASRNQVLWGRSGSSADHQHTEERSIMAAEAPNRLPMKLDLQSVHSLLSAKASATEDHIWALREGPVTSSQCFLKQMIIAWNSFKTRMGTSTLYSVISHAYFMLELFSELSLQAKSLVSLQTKYATDISPTKDLPKPFSDALNRFRFYLDQTVNGELHILRITSMASPPLRRFFTRQPSLDLHQREYVVMAESGMKKTKVERKLIYLLGILWCGGQQLFIARLPVAMGEIERLIQSEKEARELLSPYVFSVIGDLSILSQCLNQLAHFQPWARTLDCIKGEEEDHLKMDYEKRTDVHMGIVRALTNGKSGYDEALSLGDLSGGRFTYPIDKRRTRENVEALRKAESNLDSFWAAIDQIMISKTGDLSSTALHALLSQPRALQRTLEWIETEKPSTVTPTTSKEPETDVNALIKSFFELKYDSPTKKVDSVKVKVKVKTRGKEQNQPGRVEKLEVLHQLGPTDSQLTLNVDARSLKVFRTMFFNPSTTSTPGEIQWTEFLHAMTSVGFAATKLYGSAWQFEPTKPGIERNIQFHEPHPQGKLGVSGCSVLWSST
ncbi:hypothetical protein N7488_005607 [Penicillium malachiteum]|nr:hypothetical protein N7488_005607 [Penicillium malachiteum]